MFAVLLGRVDQPLGGREGRVGADGGAQLMNGRGDVGLDGGRGGDPDRGRREPRRGDDDVDGRAGAVGLGEAAGRLLGRGNPLRGAVAAAALGGGARPLELGRRAHLLHGQGRAHSLRRQRGAGVVEGWRVWLLRGGGAGGVRQVESAPMAGREGLPGQRLRREWRRLRSGEVGSPASGALRRRGMGGESE